MVEHSPEERRVGGSSPPLSTNTNKKKGCRNATFTGHYTWIGHINIENGKHNLAINTVKNVADALGISIDKLLK